MKNTFKKMAAILTGSALALSMGLTALAAENSTTSGGEQGDTSAYGYLAGKAGRKNSDTNYAGKNYAGGEQGDTSSYGYLSGSQTNTDRHSRFGQKATLMSDEERAEFYASNGIGGNGPYSDSTHMDVSALISAGIIDQTTADAIKAYAAVKHEEIHNRFTDMSNATPQERHERYAGFDREKGDSVDSLLQAGVITEAQAEAIRNFLSE